MDDLYLDKLHQEILLVMDEIVRVCKLLQIKYYIGGGTLLGAVRHKGFIPWDDDLDILMSREDFEKFTLLCVELLDSKYKLEWRTTCDSYGYLHAKVSNTETVFFEGQMYQQNEYPGIFVDIFPLDYSSGYGKRLELKKWFLQKLNALREMKTAKILEEKALIKKVIACIVPVKMIKIVECILLKSKKHKCAYYTNFASQYAVKKQTMPIVWYGEGVFLEFEGRKYNAPIEYDKFLISLYGENYMELPPKEKRRSHYPLYVKFSDGHELHFESVKERVNVE